MGEFRPGMRAAGEFAVRAPLLDAGLTKDEIRAWSSRLGLGTWDKPQMACLASRIPYGTSVTEDRLRKIGAAESELRGLGLRIFRVRYHGQVARLEVGDEERARFTDPDFASRVNERIKAQGFDFVALDLEPFRSGRMNTAVSLALPVLAS